MSVTVVIGTGTWGTVVAAFLANTGGAGRVFLLGRDQAKTAALAASRQHPQLPRFRLPDAVAVTTDPAVLGEADLILWAVPAQFSRAQARRLAGHLAPGTGVVSLAKGLEQDRLLRVSEVLAEELGQRPLAVLSGPSLAAEAAAGLPLCLVVAGAEGPRDALVERMHSSRCRLYTSDDLLGVELGGAIKNVIAIAAGIGDGLGLGDNTKAALVTRGLAELRRLGRAMGADDATFAGLAGIGDLMTTCSSPLSRNRALGLAIAQGQKPLDFLHRQQTVAEGAWTCRAAVALGARYRVELPIASQVESVIWAATPVAQAMENLLSRAPKEENA
jgi:glycerol-3-phosphate dehydrogenase (NAD(P)+)